MKKFWAAMLSCALCLAASVSFSEDAVLPESLTTDLTLQEGSFEISGVKELSLSSGLSLALTELESLPAAEGTVNGQSCTFAVGKSDTLLLPFRMEYTPETSGSLADDLASFEEQNLMETLNACRTAVTETAGDDVLTNASVLRSLQRAYPARTFADAPLLYYKMQGVPADSCWDLLFFAQQTGAGEYPDASLYLFCRREVSENGSVSFRNALITDQDVVSDLLGRILDSGLDADTERLKVWADALGIQESAQPDAQRTPMVTATPVPTSTPKATATPRPKRTPTPEPAMTASGLPIPDYVVIKGKNSVRIHAEADSSSPAVNTVTGGMRYVCLGRAENGWFLIETRKGETGYISDRYATPCRK